MHKNDKIDLETPKNSSNVVDYSNPYAIADLLDGVSCGKFGSVTKDIEALVTRKMQILSPYFAKFPILLNQLMEGGMKRNEETDKGKNQQGNGFACQKIIDLEQEQPVVIIDSDEEDDRDQKPYVPFQEVVLPKAAGQSTTKDIVVSFYLHC